MIFRGSANDWYAFPFLITFAVVWTVARYWRFFVQWLNGVRGNNWPTVSATIDIVSVAKQVESIDGEESVSYLATLTYFYRNPELQTGDYSRLFGDEEWNATTWANSFKGSTVMVHVDPHDPSNSVLRKNDL